MLPSGELVSVHEGDTIPSGWTIRKLSPEGALLRYALPRDQAVLLRLEGKQLVDAVEVAIPATPRAFAAPREQGAGPATLPLGVLFPTPTGPRGRLLALKSLALTVLAKLIH